MRAIAPSYSYSHRTQLPYLLVVTAIISIYLYRYYDVRNRIFGKISSICTYQFSIFILFISISRGPWIALTGVLLPSFLFYKNIRKDIIKLNIPSLVFSIIVAIFFGQLQRVLERVASIVQPNNTETSARLEIYNEALDVVSSKPMTGIGWNNYSVIYDIAGSAHSTYLTISSELGIPALLLYILIPIVLSRDWMRIVSSEKLSSTNKLLYLAPLAGVLGLLVGQVFSTAILWFRAYWVLLSISVATITIGSHSSIR
ncbi:O-antigen ligase family protein [Halorubrum glutamatedens]|uniref:O-antigen ligase family protein n=2 Tax=Halobacteriales TaxID=2235 RepID=A0ABD5QNB9_9EURY